MNLNRPFSTLKDFSQEQEFCLKAIKILKKHYNIYAKRKNGIVSNDHIDQKIFPKVKKEANPKTNAQELVIESLFDSFLGLMMLFGDSETAFDVLAKEIQEGKK